MGSEDKSFDLLEQSIGYSFKNKELLERALTHPSYVQQFNNDNRHNQRLEFLGDAVLGMALADILFSALPDEREGILTRYRSILANGAQLAQISKELNLNTYIRLGDAEEANGGRERESILEDAFEALLGGIYLDGGFDVVKESIERIYGDISRRLSKSIRQHNPKGQLQELLQPNLGNSAIEYKVIEETGPDHHKAFLVEVFVDCESWGKGTGSSKKQAEEEAARIALKRIPSPSNK